MSKTVDQRVVEMRFDNKDFEANVKTSMSTLEKLKRALKLDGISKGLDDVSRASRKVDFSGMSNGIETVNARFSAMQVVAMTALSNITSAAMRAGTNLVKSFTIDPIVNGFKEYELQMNSIQTILANTKSKGTTMSDVTAALDELNEYADLTIYNFAEMTKNIGTFTAAGVDLDTSVGAIKGIANLGAMSSSTSAQVSTAMYQLSQALATGRVSLMDWNSVVNAGMGGEQFQNALKRTAENFGYDVDGMIAKYGSFRDSLTQGGWLTAEVLNETLNQIGGAYDETALKAKGYSDDQIKAILDLADTATKAATEVKTFTQLMDTLKEAAGSGFAKMWQNIFGDFEQAKEFFSGLHEMLEPIVTGPIDAMNAVIEGAMGGGESRWSEFTGQLDKAGVSIDTFQKKLTEVASGQGVDLNKLIEEYGSLEKAIASGDVSADMITQTLKELAASTGDATINTAELNKTLSEYQKVVDQVWRGDYGNIDTGRIEKLKEAGWEYAEVQKLVNMTVDGHRLTLEDLTAAQIVSLGYTQEQADALVNLAKEAEAAGEPMNTLINDILNPKRSGRELFLEGIENMLTAILRPLQAVGAAFSDVFGMDAEGLYNLIDGFNKFSKSIIMSEGDAENLRKTLRGLFSVIHLVATIAGKSFTLAFQAAQTILGFFGTNILEVTGFIGDAIYTFEQWITSGEVLSDIFGVLSSALSWVIDPIKSFFGSFTSFPIVQEASSAISGFFQSMIDYVASIKTMKPSDVIKNIFDGIKTAFNNFKSFMSGITWEDVLGILSNFGEKIREIFDDLKTKFEEIGPDIIEGLQNGLKDGVDKVFEFVSDIANKVIEAAKAVLGIHSPSTVFFEIGKNIIEGLCNGIKYLSGKVTDTLSAVVEDIKNLMSGIDWGPILAIGAGVGTFVVFYQLTDALQTFATGVKQFSAPFQSAANIMNTTNDFLKKLTEGNSSNKGFANLAQGIKLIAEALAILVGSIAILTALDPAKMWGAIGAIAALAAILGGLTFAMDKFANGAKLMESINISGIMLSLAGAFLMLSVAARLIGGMEWEALGKAGAALLGFGVVVAGLVYITKYAGDVDGAAKVLSKIGIAFLLLAATAKILGTMSVGEMANAGTMMATFVGAISVLILVAQLGEKDINEASKIIGKVGIAFLLLAATAKILGGMTTGEMTNAGIMLAAFTGVVAALIAVTQIGDKKIDNVTSFIGKVGLAFIALAVAARLLGGMEPGEMAKAGVALTAFTGIIALLVLITNLAPPKKIAQISTTLLAMSASIAILAGVAALLGLIKTENLVKGVAAVGALTALVAIMTLATKGMPKDAKSTFIGISIAIAALAASLAVLSFIDPAKLATATAALSATLAAFALVVKSAKGLKKSMGSLIVLTAAIAAIGAALYLLAGLPTESVLSSALALSSVLVALAAACKILDTVGRVSKSAMKTMGILTAIMAGLAVIFGLMSALGVEASLPNVIALSIALNAMASACLILGQVGRVTKTAQEAMTTLLLVMGGLAVIFGIMAALDVQASIPNAIALSIALNAMAAACLILSGVNSIAPQALVAMGVMVVIVGLLGGVFALLNQFDMSMSLGTALSLSAVLIAMSVATGILGAIGPVASMALAGAAGLAGVLGVLTGVIAIAGGLKQIPGFDWLISEGATALQGIGNAIGGFIGGFAGGVLEGASNSLPAIGTNLSTFMTNLQPFLEGVSSIDPSKAQGLSDLANAMLTFTGSGLLDQLTEFFSGESAVDTIANQLVPFGEALVTYSQTVAGIDAGAIEASATAGKALSELANSLPKEGGLAQAIFGDTPNLEDFGTQMVQFGDAIVAYSQKVSGNIDANAIQASATAGKALSELASSLPKEGGLAQAIFGESPDMATFGVQIVLFGNALQLYSASVAGLDVGSIENSVAAGQALADLQSGLGKDGGVIGFFTGDDMNLGDFSTNLTKFGDALVKYSDKVSGIEVSQITGSTQAVQAIIRTLKANSDSADDISNGIEAVKKIGDLGDAIVSYGTDVASVSLDAISSSISAIQRLLSTITGMAGMDTSGVALFKSAIAELNTISIDGIVNTFSDAASKLSGIGSDMMQNLASGITAGASHVDTAVSTVINSISNSFLFKGAILLVTGTAVGQQFVEGVKVGTDQVPTVFSEALGNAVSSIRGYHGQFYNVGAYLSQGLASGMRSKLSFIQSAANAMAQAAKKAVQAAAQVHSPSRVFMEIGGYMGEGLVIGLKDYQSKTYDAAYGVGDSAVDGLNLAISKMSMSLDSDMDLNPTITPVLDLSNVQNGVGAIDNMFGGMAPLNILGEVGSINRAMNQRNQNGGFDDVVSAVNRLRDKLDNVGNTTYQIEGVTYDDGSNIANAVKDIARAARIERRR